MALGLGLHREPIGGAAADTLYNERRRVVWWILYCFESGLSLTTGRPLTISDSFIETHLPRNIDDSVCFRVLYGVLLKPLTLFCRLAIWVSSTPAYTTTYGLFSYNRSGATGVYWK